MAVKLDLNSIFNQAPDNTGALMRQRAMVAQQALDMEMQMRQRQAQQASPAEMVLDQAQQMPQQGSGDGRVLQGKYGITQKFGNYNPALYSGITKDSRHKGVDIATPSGTPVYAPVSGTVETGNDRNWGLYTLVRGDDGHVYRMSHLSKHGVQPGQRITPGTLLGYTGSTGNSTGPHLDISVQRNNQFIDPLSIEALYRALLGE